MVPPDFTSLSQEKPRRVREHPSPITGAPRYSLLGTAFHEYGSKTISVSSLVSALTLSDSLVTARLTYSLFSSPL